MNIVIALELIFIIYEPLWVYLNTAAEVRQGWWMFSSVLSSEEVETPEPRLPDAGDPL